jgi:hypothetical protein
VLTGVVANATTPMFDNMAITVVGARVAQSIVHVSGNTNMHVNVRFTFFVVQIACFVWMGLILATALS